MKGFKSKFCEGCKHFPCRDLDDDTEIFDCDYREYKLSLIAGNERNGEHTAPREQYWTRSERIKSKLLKCNVRRTPNVELSGGERS